MPSQPNSPRANRSRFSRHCQIEPLESRHLLAAEPIISEFLASNRETLFDSLSPPESSDWIEIHNAGDTAVDLSGWYLTDNHENLTKWSFPSVHVAANGYLIVFASANDGPDRAGNLHTNFRLNAAGEFLALVQPNGQTIVSQYGTSNQDYPKQATDISYGLVMQPTTTKLIANGASARILIPTSEIEGGWTGADNAYSDDPATTDWFEVTTAIGFGDSQPLAAITTTDIQSVMKSVNSSVYARIPFEVDDPSITDALTLRIAHDDGFVAYLNGQRIAEANAPSPLTFNAAATATHDAIGELFAVDPNHVSILYNFEDDGGQAVSDKLTDDGQQNPIFNSGGSVDSNQGRARFGSRSLRLPGSPGPPNIFNRLQLPNTANLGEQFTLAVQVNLSNNGFQRLFSNYNGTGPVGENRLIFDIDPSGSQISGLRAIIGNRGTITTSEVPAQLMESGYHHFALTYDDGDIQLYLDGELVASETLGSGPLSMPVDLYFGEDPHDGGGLANEQLSGNVDDLLVLSGSVLSPVDINLLAQEGAEALFKSGGREPLFETIDVSAHIDQLRTGTNILAIHGLNLAADDSDFFLLPELIAVNQPDGHPPAYFTEPTPGSINAMPIGGLVGDTNFSTDRGFFDHPFSVEVTIDTPGATIVYTTDGSAPTLENGMQVHAANQDATPLASVSISTTTTLRAAGFKAGYKPSNVDTQTYVFLADVLQQPNRPEGLPTRWGPTRADYEMDPEIVNTAPYSQTIIDDLKSIPTMSLTLNSEDFFGSNGIYSNTLQRGRAWERPVSVEYFDAHSDDQFQVNAGLRMHGGFSRDPSASPQHSMRLHFRSEYGPGKLDFLLFHDSDVTQFDSLVLNAQSSDNWSSINTITGRVAQFLRDQWAQDMQRELGHVHVPGKYVHLYINGLYWGVYDVMERLDDDFAAEHFGGTEEQYDVIVDEVAFRGNLSAWRDLLSRVRADDYEKTLELLDVDNFIDYLIINMYMGNWDWPDHNWHAVRRRTEGEKFKFVVWDAEVGMGLDVNIPGPIKPRVLDVDMIGRRRDVGSADVRNGPGEIYDRLRKNTEFQIRFADRLHQHFYNDGALTPERAAGVYESRASEIESALVGQSARWGDVRRRSPDVPDGVWLEEKNWILNTFFVQRGEIVLQDFKDEDLYPIIDAPQFSQHGGEIVPDFELAISNSNGFGQILFTKDGTDPRLPGGEIAATAIAYVEATKIAVDTTVRARIFSDGQWSALNQATFTAPDELGDFNDDGTVDAADIQLLCEGLHAADIKFDLNADANVDHRDLAFLVEDVLHTTFGDANLDGTFDSTDLVSVFQTAEYDDQIEANSTWSEGDWNCDNEFDSTDLVVAFQAGGFKAAAQRSEPLARPRYIESSDSYFSSFTSVTTLSILPVKRVSS